MTKVEQRLAELAIEEKKLLKKLETQRANKQFKCGCGKMHKIKDCVAIQTHYYVPPSGCTDGAYWSDSEMQVICPITDKKSRLMFNNNDVDWTARQSYGYNAYLQFKYIYLKLFKEVIQDYEKDERLWWNNYYFDRNHEKFGLHIIGRDYGKKKG
jgi:hypothetical protein